jgi:outer membrane protein OmpA-like peptidoglycan-associated protein
LEVKKALGIQHYRWDKSTAVRRNSSLYIILALILLAAIAFFLYRSCQSTTTTASLAPADTTVTSVTPGPVSTDTVSSANYQVTLPNGKVLQADKGGTEDQLVGFLGDPQSKLDKKNGNWFDFTKVGFASNSASLLLESETQLKNIVAILDAFPKSKIKIGGYSDNTGDSANNVRLSQERATNILSKLKDLGAKHSQLTGAEGYGSHCPVGDNGTSTGRATNRRMSINVKAK